MSAANDPNANPPYPERDDAPETGQLNPSQTTGEGGTPPRPAPKVRIQRGATVYAPWRRGDAPPSPAPPPPSGDTPQPPASPSLVNYATPAVAPTVVIRHAPGSQNWTATEAGSEPTVEMTIEFAAIAEEELAQSAPPQFIVIKADAAPAGTPPPTGAAPVSVEAPVMAEASPAPIAAEPISVAAPLLVEAPPVTEELKAEATEFVAPKSDAPAVVAPMKAATPVAPSAELAAEKTPVPAEAAVETTAFVPAETKVPSEIEAPTVTEPDAPLTPPVLAEAATPPAFLPELEPESLALPVAAEAEILATPPPTEFPSNEAAPEPVAAEPIIAAEPIVEIPPFPELDPIPLVPEIALLAETLPLTAAFRQTIPLLAPLPLPEPPILAPVAAEESPAASEAVGEPLEAAVEAVSLVVIPPASAEAKLAPVEPSPVERVGVEGRVDESAVPLLSPEIETVPQAFAPPVREASAEAVSAPPQEALADEAFAHEFAPVAEEKNVPIPIAEAENTPAPVAPEFPLPVKTETETSAPLAATEEPAFALLAESADATIIIPPAALADAAPIPPPEYAALQEVVETESAPVIPTPVETEPVAANESASLTPEPPMAESIPSPTATLAAAAITGEKTPLDVAPVLPPTRRATGTPSPPAAQAPPETAAKPRGLLRPNREPRPAVSEPGADSHIEKVNRAAAPPPVIPGDRLGRQEIAEGKRVVRREEERREAAERRRFLRTPLPLSPALPGVARFFTGVGLVCAALGLLARPLADAAKGTAPLAAVANFANALEGDSRMQWRNLQRRPEGGAISASRRKEARVVVILAEQRRGASQDEYPMGRVELAQLMRLCHDAGVPVIGVAADTAALPRTTAIAVGGPQRMARKAPDPLAAAIRDIRQAGADIRPTFTVLPASFPSVVQGKATSGGETLRANTDPLLPSKGIVRGFIGPSPIAADFGEEPQKGMPLRRSLTLSARVAPPPGGTDSAISLPAALVFLTLPGAALWPQIGGTETSSSDIARGLSAIFAYPSPQIPGGKPGEQPVGIDFGLLQSDPEGVQVVSADYVRSLSVGERRTLLERRPVVIGLDRPVDRIQTPLSSPRFIVLSPVKPTMAAAEAEGRAAAMLLARAERNSQPGNLMALSASQLGDAALPERPGRIFSAVTLPPPAPYLEPVPTDDKGWLAFLPAALLGYLLAFAGRRLAAPAVKAKEPKPELKPARSSTRFWGNAAPLVLGIALAGIIGWAWRVYGTPGFASYIEFPGFAPWAAPWAASLLTAGIFALALIGMWMLGPAWGGKGVALILAFTALAFGALVVQDFVLFPAWTPLLAPLGGFLLGSALQLGSRR